MPKDTGFIKSTSIKQHITKTKMRSSKDAIKKLVKKFNTAIKAVINDAKKLAKEDRRTTIMDRDITLALEKHLGKKNLTWQETSEEIIKHNPTDLGNISKEINKYIRKSQGK